VVSEQPTELGPLKSRRLAQAAARVLAGFDDPTSAPAAIRARLRGLAGAQRFEDAARLRDRLEALERVLAELAELDRLRRLELCLVVPAVEVGFERAFFLRAGRVAATRTVPGGAAGRLELETGLAAALHAEPSLAAEDADELLLVGSFLRRPPPELRVVPLAALQPLAA